MLGLTLLPEATALAAWPDHVFGRLCVQWHSQVQLDLFSGHSGLVRQSRRRLGLACGRGPTVPIRRGLSAGNRNLDRLGGVAEGREMVRLGSCVVSAWGRVAIPWATWTQIQPGRVALEPGHGGAGLHPFRNAKACQFIQQHFCVAPIKNSNDRSDSSVVAPHPQLFRLVGQLLLFFTFLDATSEGRYLRVGRFEESTSAKIIAFCA